MGGHYDDDDDPYFKPSAGTYKDFQAELADRVTALELEVKILKEALANVQSQVSINSAYNNAYVNPVPFGALG